MTEEQIQKVINEKPDSIEWRLETGKSVKVYGDASKPKEFNKNLLNAIKILKELE